MPAMEGKSSIAKQGIWVPDTPCSPAPTNTYTVDLILCLIEGAVGSVDRLCEFGLGSVEIILCLIESVVGFVFGVVEGSLRCFDTVLRLL